MNIRKHWGEWLQQTVGTRKNGDNYIHGYDSKGRLVEVTFKDSEAVGLAESILTVQRRKG